jgi:hypothetical protein
MVALRREAIQCAGWAKALLRRAHRRRHGRARWARFRLRPLGFGGQVALPTLRDLQLKAAAGVATGGCWLNGSGRYYFGYLNSGAAFSASLVVFIDASHLSFFWS